MTHCVKRTKSWQKRCLYLILGRRSCKHVLDMLQFVSKNYNNVKYIKVFHELSLQWNCPSALGLERDSASSMAWVFLLCGPQDWTVVGWTGWVSQGLFSLKRLELCHLERFWFQILSDWTWWKMMEDDGTLALGFQFSHLKCGDSILSPG